MAGSSTRAVVTAVTANAIVSVAKFIGFAVSGSGAMLSEAIHSVADTTNQALLLLGLRRSTRAPDPQHRFGYGRARFFWGLVSALGIFFVGAGVTLYHGIHALLHPEPAEHTWVTWAVLSLAVVLEGGAGLVAIASVRASARQDGVPFMTYVREGRDPTAIAVLLEDGAAVLGLLLAIAGIGLGELTGWPGWDALASIAIGVLLGVVALFLVASNRRFLLDVAVDPAVLGRVRQVLDSDPLIEDVASMKSVVGTLGRYRFHAEVEFDGRTLAGKLFAEDADGEAARTAARADDEAMRAYLEGFADRVVERLGDEVDALEARIRAEVPEAAHIDLEAD